MIDSGIYVWIESSDRTVYHEHGYNETVSGRKECWIESKQGENFTICWRFIGTTLHCLQAVVWLDGVRTGGGLLRPEQLHQTFRMSGTAIGSDRRLPFQFGKQQLTDDDTIAPQDDPKLAELNTIRIVVQFAAFVDYTDAPTAPKMRGAVHERAAKNAHSDSTVLGEPTRAMPRRWCRTERLPHLGRFEFIFRYAPRDWLMARGIIPRPEAAPRGPLQAGSSSRSPRKEIRPKPVAKSQPLTPNTQRKRAHTSKQAADNSDDSDVVILSDSDQSPGDKMSKTKRARTESTPILGAATGSVYSSDNNDVIDLGSSDVD